MPDNYLDTSETNFTKALTDQIVKTLQTNLRATLPHVAACDKATFVKGTNNTLRYLRVSDLSVVAGTPSAGTPPWLTEGVTPSVEPLAFGYEEFSANQAGRIVGLTDVAMEMHPVDLFGVAVERITRNIADTTDRSIAETIKAGTHSTLFGGTGNTQTSDVAAGDVMTGALLRRGVATLKADKVPMFGDGYYHAIINPAVVFDIQGDDAVGGWLDANKYAGAMALMSGEIGKYAGVRFIESANAYFFDNAGTGSIDVYSTVIFGPGAFVFGDWGSTQVYVTAPGGKGDELHQRAAVGWKGKFGSKIILSDNPRYLRIETASAL